MPFYDTGRSAPRADGIPLIRAGALAPTLAFLRRIGAPVDRLIERASLCPDDLYDADTLVPLRFANRLIESAASATGVSNLGLVTTRDVDPFTLGTYGRLMAGSRTVGGALDASVRLKPAWNTGARVWVTGSGSDVQLHHRFAAADAETWTQSVAINLMLHVNFLHNATGGRWRPRRIRLPGEPSRQYSEVPKLADTRMEFGAPWTTITFPASLLALPLTASPGPTPVAVRPFEAPARDLVASVRELVASRLPSGYPSMPLIADAAGMNVRTFQRRLAHEGTTYAELVAGVRLSTASRLLVESDRKIIDIGLDLGYSDAAHFTRAFTRWAGVSPFEFRRSYRARESA